VRSLTGQAVEALSGAPLQQQGTEPLADVARALAARVG